MRAATGGRGGRREGFARAPWKAQVSSTSRCWKKPGRSQTLTAMLTPSLIETICVDEIEKVAQHIESAHGDHTLDEVKQPLSALNPGEANTTAMRIGSNGGSSKESRLLAKLRTLPEDVEAVVQNEVRVAISSPNPHSTNTSHRRHPISGPSSPS